MMQRVLRRGFYSRRRQREVAYGLIAGCSATAGFTAWRLHNNPVVKADSEVPGNSTSWTGRPTVLPRSADASDAKSRTPGKDDQSLPSSFQPQQTPPPQTKGHSTFDSEGDLPNDKSVSAWQSLTNRVGDVSDSFTGFDFTSLRTKIASFVLPSWIRVLPRYVDKLRAELSGAEWSLGWEIWEDAHDPESNPEILWDARVRLSNRLCPEEQRFLTERRRHTPKALARYIGVPESEVHPDDVPVIAMCGSGGGLRALVAGASSYLSTQEAGLFDCVTYTAGVSGSCWLQTLYYSSIGRQNYEHIIHHLKNRLGVHIAYPPAALSLLSQAPTNKFLLSGLVEKLRGVPKADFGLVDIYGLLLAARLLVPKGDLGVSALDLKISNQQFYVDDGSHPLPIYTAVRHEIPAHLEDKGELAPSQYAWHNTKHYDWFQWFEWTPYEFFCEELECGIPTWAVGRQWNAGQPVWRENGLALPELRVPLMMGIWGSAFCATLSHYYKEIRPILKAAGLGKLDSVLAGKDDDLVKVHPIDPALIPNFALGLRGKLPDTVPESVHKATNLQLMDAGMSNNLPIYPLLRPGRDVDIIVAFDASADVKTDNWVKVVDGYVRQRGIKGWPMGAGWPSETDAANEEETVSQLDHAVATNETKLPDALEETRRARTREEDDLGYCTIWVGTTEERTEYMDEPAPRRVIASSDSPSSSAKDDGEWHLTRPDAGITLIYFPFLANEKVPGVDPAKADFMSTWNFVYTPDEIEKVVALARANFDEGKEQTRRAVRAVWERKRKARLARERREREFRRAARVGRGSAQMRRNGDVGQGDQFGI